MPDATDRTALDPATILVDGQPAWDRIGFDVLCPRCDYNLRLLPQPRCPECGLEFRWLDVLFPPDSDFLFEHHWHRRPVRSWLKTAWRALRPRRFWRDVAIHERICAGPLWFMLASAVPACLLALHGLAALGWLAAEMFRIWVPNPRRGQWGTSIGLLETGRLSWLVDELSWILKSLAILPHEIGWSYALLPCGVTLILLATLTFLCALRQTLGRCRVRSVQVLRVVAYAGVPTGLLSGVYWVLLTCLPVALGSIPSPPAAVEVAAGNVVPLLMFGAFVSIGLKHYLHLPRAWLVGLTAVGVACLFMFTAYALFATLAGDGG